MKKIIVPTDFSENAIIAGKLANEIALQVNAKLEFVHSYTYFQSGFQSKEQIKENQQEAFIEAQENMKDYFVKIELSNQVGVESVISDVDLLDVLKKYEEDPSVILVVAGTNGASGIKYHFLGSNSFDIAQKIELPLLIVPAKAEIKGKNTIVFFTDFHEEDLYTIHGLKELFNVVMPEIQVVHLQSEGLFTIEENKLRMENLIYSFKQELPELKFKGLVLELPENAEGVEKVVFEHGVDWISLTMADRSIWDKLMDKSLSKAIILNPYKPVFINNRLQNL